MMPATHVILSTLGTGGDVFPFIAIGQGLAGAGCDVTVVTNACYMADVEAAALRGVAIDSPDECDRMIQDGPLLTTGGAALTFVDRHIAPRLAVEADAIRQHVVPDRTVLLTRALPGLAARIVADELRLPLIGVMMAPSNLAGWRLSEHLVASHLAPVVNGVRHRRGLPPIADWPAWLTYRDCIGLWPEWYGPRDPAWPFDVRLVGFVPAESTSAAGRDDGGLDEAIERELTADPRSVLITAGTGYFGAAGFFDVAVDGCRRAGCRPILVCPRRDLIPAHLPAHSLTFATVPLMAALMRRVAIVCHHGGMGTLSQALSAAVPQVVMATGGDRPDNAARLEKLGVAAAIPAGARTGSHVAAALQGLLSSSAVRQRCRELALRVREQAVLPAILDAVRGVHARAVTAPASWDGLAPAAEAR